MPHAAVVGQVALKTANSVKDVGGRGKGLVSAQRRLLAVVVGRSPRRIQPFKFTDITYSEVG